MSLPDGLYMSSEARGLLDNLAPTRVTATGTSRTLTRAEVEEWLDSLCAARGEQALNRLRDQARELAPVLGREKELSVLDALISAALNTRDGVSVVSPAMKARAAGQPIDQQRLHAFARIANSLAQLAPDVLPALPQDEDRRQLLPFYEAYFSNYIEGTEFTLDEAAAIVFDNAVPEQRPGDAHDVLGTYQLTSSDEEMRRTPQNGDELVDILKYRHAIVLSARTDKNLGQFKTRANRAGSTEFVAPELVEGTLRSGFDEGKTLISPFARAVFMMFLVSEVHPFVDGNGRVARLMMNSELVRAGEVRIVIPTVYRLTYLAGLKAATHTANDSALVAILSFARRWTARINFTDRATAEADLERTNALRDAREAEDAGIRLTLP
jgi:Fic family protein